jgi:hypothetical protein
MTSMPILSRGPGGKPVMRALLAALEESAPGAHVAAVRRIVGNRIGKAVDGDFSAIEEIFGRIAGKAPAAAAGTGEPTKVVLAWKSDPWCSRRT